MPLLGPHYEEKYTPPIMLRDDDDRPGVRPKYIVMADSSVVAALVDSSSSNIADDEEAAQGSSNGGYVSQSTSLNHDNMSAPILMGPSSASRLVVAAGGKQATKTAETAMAHNTSSFFPSNSLPTTAMKRTTTPSAIVVHNISRDLPNVTLLDSFPTTYSGAEFAIMLVVVIVWSYAVYLLWQSWAWNLRPPRDPLRRKKLSVNKRLMQQFSTGGSKKRNVVASLGSERSFNATREMLGFSIGQGDPNSPQFELTDYQPPKPPRPRTAADLINELEGPSAPRPRGLSRVLVVSSEDETVLFEKPGSRLKAVLKMRKSNEREKIEQSARNKSLRGAKSDSSSGGNKTPAATSIEDEKSKSSSKSSPSTAEALPPPTAEGQTGIVKVKTFDRIKSKDSSLSDVASLSTPSSQNNDEILRL